MPAIFDLEYYARLQPAPGIGPGRFLAVMFAMAIRDQADRWMLGPDPKFKYGAECYYFISGVKHGLVPPPIAHAATIARFLRQLVGGNGALTLQLGERQLGVYVRIDSHERTDQITVELPISSALHEPAAKLLEAYKTRDNSLIEFADTEFGDDIKERGPWVRFQIRVSRPSDLLLMYLGRQREPFHSEMQAPTKFLMLVLFMCVRDRATEIRFSPVADTLWTRYLVDNAWHDLVPPPSFVWPQLVRVIERHARLIRPESANLDVPAVGWLELRFGQDYSPDNLAVFLDPREDSSLIRINFMSVSPKKPETNKADESPAEDDGDDSMMVEFSPDDD